MTEQRKYLGRLDGTNLFQWLFIVAALIAASVTFYTITSVDPTRPFTRSVLGVFVINIVLIIALGILLIRRYRMLQSDSRTAGQGRLVRRFLLMFSLSSVLPATVVALFLGVTITRGLDNWFDTRVGTLVEDSAELARENVDDVSAGIEVQMRQVASRINFADAAEGITTDPELYRSFLGQQGRAFGFRAVYLVSETGELIITGDATIPLPFNPPLPEALMEAREGLIGLQAYQQTGFVTAVMQLDHPGDAFLFGVYEISPEIFARLNKASNSVAEYRQAETASGQLQTFFAIGYAQVVTLALLLFGRFGLEAGSQIAGPLGRLARAAELVRDGDLTARVPLPGSEDEIDTLTESFNTMTAQLGAQRSALLSARTISEDRRQFLETLLSQVSAGVIRVDRSMSISLANRSAEELIGQEKLQGKILNDVLPEFALHAHAVMRDGGTGDASLETSIDGETRHIRLRTLAAPDGGCVLTFDDATRIVTAQRHMAWRDVARRIAHEIRNPLTPIQLAAERLRRRYGKTIAEDDDVFDRSLQTIMRQVTDIGRMVDEFSNFARMPKPQITPFSFTSMLNDTVFSQRVVSPDVKFEIDQPAEELDYSGDERLLGQAFGNLLKNATEAINSMPAEDEVHGNIKLSLSQSAGLLQVIIEDNGPGFPEELRDRLLEPYVSTRERGTGLGLAIVNRVIIDHGGSISLQRRDDDLRGARVVITLPIGAEPGAGEDNNLAGHVLSKETAEW